MGTRAIEGARVVPRQDPADASLEASPAFGDYGCVLAFDELDLDVDFESYPETAIE